MTWLSSYINETITGNIEDEMLYENRELSFTKILTAHLKKG